MEPTTLERLEELGFDRSYPDEEGYIRVRCSQCQATTVNGEAVHEHRCPNSPGTCVECWALTVHGRRMCEDCTVTEQGFDEEE